MRWPKMPQPGDELKAETLQAIIEILSQIIRPQEPLKFERTRNDVVLSLDLDSIGNFGFGIGVTSGSIGPRSGMTVGTGTVSLLKFSAPTFSSDKNISVYNITGTIASGKWVIVAKIYGKWFIVAVAC